jgi:hypothetical protein
LSGGFPDASTDKTSATFKFTAGDALSAPVTYQCKLDTGALVSCTSPTTVDTLAQGGHTFMVRATDSVGNSATLPYSWTVVADQGNDSNGDGVVDATQPNVTSVTSDVTNKTVALQVDSVCQIEQAAVNSASDNAVADAGYVYPNGMFNFSVNCGAVGFTTTVTQYYYDIAATNLVLRKYDGSSHSYSPVNAATISTTNVYGHTVTAVSYQVTDGGPLDEDHTANGVIVDPAGLAAQVIVAAPAATSAPAPNSSSTASTPAPTSLAYTGATYLGLLVTATVLCVLGAVLDVPRRIRRR